MSDLPEILRDAEVVEDLSRQPEQSEVMTFTHLRVTPVRAGVGYRLQITYSNPDVPHWKKVEMSQKMFPNEAAARQVGDRLADELLRKLHDGA